ncbi:hypothetical protein T492DRAFT_844962 [Pavlovales sp. CCMP2436]|nr:hypothetical protein T492DRAFT_844962 [Pavlovales sp. CCMP2436]
MFYYTSCLIPGLYRTEPAPRELLASPTRQTSELRQHSIATDVACKRTAASGGASRAPSASSTSPAEPRVTTSARAHRAHIVEFVDAGTPRAQFDPPASSSGLGGGGGLGSGGGLCGGGRLCGGGGLRGGGGLGLRTLLSGGRHSINAIGGQFG